MNQEEILNCILHPDRLKEITFDRLKQALIDYPYSQNLRFLLAQKSMQEEHPDFERHLKTAATYMSNRSFLRKQLQGSDQASQPIVEPEPEAEPAQGNSSITVAPEALLSNLPDEELPPVLFIPDTSVDEVVPNHVADIVTDTPPADQPPPTETSPKLENPELLEKPENPGPIPPIISKISLAGNQVDDPEIAPVEKKILVKHEPIVDQPRIIHEPVIKADPEEPITLGSNIPDLSEPELEEISDLVLEEEDELDGISDLALDEEELDGISDLALDEEKLGGISNLALDEEELEEISDLELDEETLEILAAIPPAKESEIVKFPKRFEVEDEMDDLLSKPLIEVVPERFGQKDQELEPEPEDEDDISDLLLEGFDEVYIEEDLETELEEPLTIQPELGKWMKKYQSSEEQKSEKVKKQPKKTKKKEKKAKKKETAAKPEIEEKEVEKTVKNKEVKPKKAKKKKKKTDEKKLSKKKAIRKFASRSIVEDGETISVTLADLYVKQGKIEKAIVAYERLSLIIPEKKAFFASLIKKLKKK